MLSDPCNFAINYRLYRLYDAYQGVISNKEMIAPNKYKSEPDYIYGAGWYGGYSFKHFWSNCYALLGDIAKMDGMQQLCHQYYLHNGSMGAKMAVFRIKKFLGFYNE